MLRTLYFTCLLSLLSGLGYAQTSTQPGYAVTLAGDTTRGVVATQNGARSALSCRFQPTGQAEFTTYLPTQLRAYGTSSYAYQAFPVAAEAQATEARFLAVVERGPVSLFLLVEAGSHERFFITDAAGKLVELRQVIRPRPDLPSGNVVETNNFYRGDLERAFHDCPAAQHRAQQVSFNLQAIQGVVRYYNNCRQPASSQPTNGRPAEPALSRVRLSAVYSLPVYSTFSLGAGQGRVPADDKLTGNYYLSGGLLLAVGGRYHDSHVLFLSGLLGEINRGYSAQRAYPNLSYDPLYQYSRVDAAFDYLKLPLLLRYTWSGATVRPYLEAGLYVRALLKVRRNSIADTYTNFSPTPPTVERTYPLLSERIRC